MVRCGAQHCCAFTPGVTGVQCFGDNTDGQAGGNYEQPGPVEVQGNVTEARFGCDQSVLTDLGVECWGANDFNQFGDGGPGGETRVWYSTATRDPRRWQVQAVLLIGRDNAMGVVFGGNLVRSTAASTLAAPLARGAQRRPQSFLRLI